jgi:hypothetical protein
MDNNEVLFEVETLQDWRIEAGANQEPVEQGGASNSNSTNNSADEP